MITLKTQQTKNLTNTQANKQANTFTNIRIGVIREVITQDPTNQLNPLAQELSVTVYDIMLLRIIS